MSEMIPPPSGEPNQPKTSKLAISSLVLGILSLPLTFLCLSIFAAVPGVICGHKALSRIKRSGGALEGQGMAIGGLVTGYLGVLASLLVIPMMLAIAIPNFTRAREVAFKNQCLNNLSQIQAAKLAWALAKNTNMTAIPTGADLAPYLAHGMMPACPKGGTYSINAVTNAPTCTIPGHEQD